MADMIVARSPLRVLAFVDEMNLIGAARKFNKRLEWDKLPHCLANPDEGRDLVEMVVYIGLPPNTPEHQEKREKKSRFVHALRRQGFLIVTKEGSPAGSGDDGRPKYKANVDVLLGIDAMDLATQIRPDVVVLVTGDSDFAHLATSLHRRGIRVEVAAIDQTLGNELRAAANSVIDLRQLFNTFESMRPDELNRIGGADVMD